MYLFAVFQLFPWSGFLETLGKFKYGYVFPKNDRNSKS